ncbi:MAG TPA: tetratricopeptide repeat protein [Bryobacteraceae bacterium]|nr:tetratricopeptide repeat protein [Bryobacteraceae bacterium]
MTSTFRAIAFSIALACAGAATAQVQNAPAAHPPDKQAAAYYNFAMGHMYAELAGAYGYRSDYVDKAIEHYRAALAADPGASAVSEELTDLYMQSGKLRDAVTMAEETLKANPDNVDARRMLGRIYSRLIGDQQNNRLSEPMLKKAIEQYEKVVAKEPGDTDSWLMLGRLHKIALDSINSEKAYKKALELDPDNEFAISGLAQVYSDLGDTKAALEMWKKLADKDPRPQALRALASAYEQAHDYKSAAQTLQRALEDAPKDTELKKNLAEDLLMAEQFDDALKLYTELAAADPNDARMQVQLSRIYRAKRDFTKAHAAQDRARQLDPDNLDIKYNEVNLLETEGRTADAIARMTELIAATEKKTYTPSEQTNRGILFQQLGSLYRYNEQYPEAVASFQRAVESDPDSASRATAQIIDTWRMAKEFQKAEVEAEAALKKFPNDRAVKVVRASLLADMGRTDEAAAAMRQLLDGKTDRETYIALAQIYDKGKRYKEEGEALDAAAKLAKDDDEKETVLFLRGAMYEKMKRLDLAEAEFRKVLAIDPDNASAMNYLGYMLADRNIRLQEAHGLISKALQLEPNNGAFLDSLGWVNFRLGKLEEAEANLLAALARTARDPTVHDHLGDVYLQRGKVKDAIAQWEISLREWDRSAKSEYDPAEIAKVQKKLEGARVRQAKEGGVGSQTHR